MAAQLPAPVQRVLRWIVKGRRRATVPRRPGYAYTSPHRSYGIKRTIERMARRPVFSIVVALGGAPEDGFLKMLGSVQGQWYPRWELILAGGQDAALAAGQSAGKLSDPRVKNISSEKNEGVSSAINQCLAAACGDYVVFLDQDGELTADCLFELARCVNGEDPDYIYSDEDRILADGSFGDVFFKPGWSPDTLMSVMYTGHVSCVRRALLVEVGGLRPEFDGAQDWDFALRVAEKTGRIAHIPRVLYHGRAAARRSAGFKASPEAIGAGRRAQAAALARRGLAGTVEELPQLPGRCRIKYAVRGQPLVSIIIPSKNNAPILERCIGTIQQNSSYRNFEIVLLDNGSSETATLAYLKTLAGAPDIKMVRHDAPFNYSELNNLGARASAGEILLFLNDDTEVLTPDWIERMAGYAQLGHVGAVGAKLLYPGGDRIQHAGVLNLAQGPNHAFLQHGVDAPGYFLRNLVEYDWAAVTGACLMIERRKFDAADGFDEAFPVAYNDVDLCFRLVEQGLYNVVCQAVRLIHHDSFTRGSDADDEHKFKRLALERAALYAKHPRFLNCDPFYNVNLARSHDDFALESR
ncbi:MAG: glycosyltransferase family 2 protein [Burkholderiaceae bacterium]|jgi:GT2 family glycosyltransferase|nr:glycosyltransferase family 2 protein [Burkholderiaceae bacterium]